MSRAIEIAQAAMKRVASYWKDTWDLADYPVRVSRRDRDSGPNSSRLQSIPWSAQIVNWWQMAGYGDTKEEALENLRASFTRYQSSHGALPRPGTGAPIEFADTDLVDQYHTLARGFIKQLFDLNADDCFISNESSLWDFHGDDTNDAYYKKILIIYGVDVSDVEGARLGQIFERIALQRNPSQ